MRPLSSIMFAGFLIFLGCGSNSSPGQPDSNRTSAPTDSSKQPEDLSLKRKEVAESPINELKELKEDLLETQAQIKKIAPSTQCDHQVPRITYRAFEKGGSFYYLGTLRCEVHETPNPQLKALLSREDVLTLRPDFHRVLITRTSRASFKLSELVKCQQELEEGLLRILEYGWITTGDNLECRWMQHSLKRVTPKLRKKYYYVKNLVCALPDRSPLPVSLEKDLEKFGYHGWKVSQTGRSVLGWTSTAECNPEVHQLD